MAVTSLPLAWRSAAELSQGMIGVGFCLRRSRFFQQRDKGIPRPRARVTFALGGKIISYLPPAAPFLSAAKGAVPCLRARVTFGPSPKSDQKCRSKLRFENPPAPRTWHLAVLRSTRTRQGVDHPKCGIDLRLSPLPLNVQNAELRTGAFQSKSGSAQRNTSVQHFGRIRTLRQAAEGNPKTMGFWRRSFPHFFRC